jgi:WD40 repeat protein
MNISAVPEDSGLDAAVARIRVVRDGLVLGAGFLLPHGLVATCAHVLPRSPEGHGRPVEVWVEFPQLAGPRGSAARVVPETWREPEAEDVVLLELAEAVLGTKPLRLRSTPPLAGARLATFGFPEQALPDGHRGSCRAGGAFQDRGRRMLQLKDANDVARGFSGAPLVDEYGLVVGMVTAFPGSELHGRGRNIAYATPADILQRLWPALAASGECPYPGLAAFTTHQHRWYYGRSRVVTTLREHLARHTGVTLLMGPSGSGKTSLVAAGLMPELAVQPLPVPPGTDPRTVPAPQVRRAGTDVERTLSEDIERITAGPGLLVIDQFEELLTAALSDGRTAADGRGPTQEILQRLRSAASGPCAGQVLLVVRADYYEQLLEAGLLDAVGNERLLPVPPYLTSAEVHDLIVRPADDQGWAVDPVLVERLTQQAVDPVTGQVPVHRLPLIALTLRRLWQYAVAPARQGPVDPLLTPAHLEATGGLAAAIATHCDATVRGLSEADQDLARRLLTALVDDTDPTRPLRRRLTAAELADRIALNGTQDNDHLTRVLDHLQGARLLATVESTTPDDPGRPGIPTNGLPERFELTHDSVIDHWTTLHQWLEKDREQRRWVERILPRAQEWAKDRDEGRLLRGADLARARESAAASRLPRAIQDFLASSENAARNAQRVTRRWLQGLATLAVIALAAAGVASWQWRTAIDRQTELEALTLTASSRAALSEHPARARLYALAAAQRAVTRTSLNALEEALASPAAEISHTLAGHSAGAYSIAWSPDGTRLATGSFDNTARLWDAATGTTTATLTGHTNGVSSVAWSPDGTRLATGSFDNTARLWDAATGTTTATLTGHTNWVTSVAWSSDSMRLATASTDKTARIWDPATGKIITTLTGHTDWVNAVAWSPDGSRLVTASSDGTARVWDAVTGKTVTSLSGHAGPVWSVVWSPDGSRLVTASSDGTARVWDAVTGKTVTSLSGHAGPVWSVAWSPDGSRLVTASSDGTARVWDAVTGKTVTSLSGHTDWVRSVAWSPDGTHLATASTDGTARVWQAVTQRTALVLVGHTSSLRSVAWSPDGTRLATASTDKTARIWDVATGKTRAILAGHAGPILSVAWSPDGTRLATASGDGSARVWDVVTGTTTAILTGHRGSVLSLAWSPDGTRLATASTDKTARIWDPATGKTVTTLTGHTDWVASVTWSPDNNRLATASLDDTARVWDVATGKPIATLSGHTDDVMSVAWSPDGTRLATASADKAARIWDAATGKLTTTLTGHTDPLMSVAWSPDGTRLATASADKAARIWDAATGKLTTTLTGHTGWVYSVAWSPDGIRLATASADETALTHSLPKSWPTQVCAVTGRNLTREEWADALGDTPYHRQCPQWPTGEGAPTDAPADPLPDLTS